MFNLFNGNKIPQGQTLIAQTDLALLQSKAELLDQLQASGALAIAQKITSNAQNVSQSSANRLQQIEQNFDLVQGFIKDTRVALEGSSSNVELGEQLMIQLRLNNG